MAKQLKLEAQPKPVPSTLIVTREEIPTDLDEHMKRILRTSFDLRAGECFFFHDSPEVRRVLRKRS